MYRIIGIVGALFAVSLAGGSAHAELSINIGSTSIAAGGTGTVDVAITMHPGDQLALTNFTFLITQTSGTGELGFLPTQNDSELTSSQGSGTPPLPADYLFLGNSFDYSNGLNVGNVGTNGIYANNQFVGGDFTNDFSNVSVTSPTTFLLARLDLVDQISPIAGAIDTFTIQLVSASGDTNDPSYTTSSPTFFTDNSYINSGLQDFASNSGTVTITASVPEPTSLFLMILGGTMVLAANAISRKFQANTVELASS
jgi:hypothetical protein